MLKIIHGADFHLDSPFAGLAPERAAQRREEQRALLQEAATPLLRTERTAAQGQQLTIELAAKKNGVVYFEVNRAPLKPNRGYDYQKVLEF